jgi:tRNA 2-thiouridine synthesizing protein A
MTAPLDLTGVLCPMNWVRARLALEDMEAGETLQLLVDPGEPLDSIPRMAGEEGHRVIVDGCRVTIVKSAA